ncbi:MAG TPA: DUF4337 domain-containing protein [Pyrinomonadaceae bacterium]|jgi:hypothetical protein|nr:DUF4337 domain-containing protein [Pyrinomonadaceae bacterium]
MEAGDAAEQILEIHDETGGEKNERFRSRTALLIAFMAMLLAITSLGGGNAAEEIMNNNIEASDTWAFYQAKTIRQTSNKLAADALETELQIHRDTLTPEVRADLQRRIDEYGENVERYESEPDPQEPADPLKGEGRKELSARARSFQAKRDRAQRQDPNFDLSEALFQIAIVLASVAIISNSRLVLKVSVVTGVLAFLLMLNGYLLFLDLPF